MNKWWGGPLCSSLTALPLESVLFLKAHRLERLMISSLRKGRHTFHYLTDEKLKDQRAQIQTWEKDSGLQTFISKLSS